MKKQIMMATLTLVLFSTTFISQAAAPCLTPQQITDQLLPVQENLIQLNQANEQYVLITSNIWKQTQSLVTALQTAITALQTAMNANTQTLQKMTTNINSCQATFNTAAQGASGLGGSFTYMPGS